MISSLIFKVNSASSAEIARHLTRCDKDFRPPLSSRVDIEAYAIKIAGRAFLFEAWSEGDLVGLIAAYFDVVCGKAFVSNVSVLAAYRSLGLAGRLLNCCIERARELSIERIELEVDPANKSAVRLYDRHGFNLVSGGTSHLLVLSLSGINACSKSAESNKNGYADI